MKDFSKDILHTIEQEQIAPRPRWVFLMRQLAWIGGFLLSVLIGGVAVSVILFSLSDIDSGAGRMMRMHPGSFLMTYLPYVWVLTLVAFGIVAYYDMRNIKGIYRYRAIAVLGVGILASVIIGGLLHAAGAGRIAERRFAQAIPQYQGLDSRKMHLWMRPQEGMLAGRIVSGSATSTFMLQDFTGTQWTVDASDAEYHGGVSDGADVRVRVAGSIERPGVFRATDIFPWERRGMMQESMMLQGLPNGIEGRGMMMRERNVPVQP